MTLAGDSGDTTRPAILVCFDENYAPAAWVTLNSLLRNNPDLGADICAAVNDVTAASRAHLTDLAAGFGRRIHFLEMAAADYAPFRAMAHLSQAAYFRILAIDRIPADRVLYLDVDLVVQADIAPLLATDLDGALVAGVPTPFPQKDPSLLGMAPDEPYLNSGVLLIDARTWRAERVLDTLSAYHQRYQGHIRWADQDIVNGALQGRKRVIDGRWNATFSSKRRGEIQLGDPDAFEGIYHFTSSDKPWHAWYDDPYTVLWRRYEDGAPMVMASPTLPAFYLANLRYARALLLRGRPAMAARAAARAGFLIARGGLRAAGLVRRPGGGP